MKMEDVFNAPVPITEDVSVDQKLVSLFFHMAYPNKEEALELIEQVIHETFDKNYNPDLGYFENLMIINTKSSQALLQKAIEKGIEL